MLSFSIWSHCLIYSVISKNICILNSQHFTFHHTLNYHVIGPTYLYTCCAVTYQLHQNSRNAAEKGFHYCRVWSEGMEENPQIHLLKEFWGELWRVKDWKVGVICWLGTGEWNLQYVKNALFGESAPHGVLQTSWVSSFIRTVDLNEYPKGRTWCFVMFRLLCTEQLREL